MEQKDYKLEIMKFLLKKKSHVRKIAKQINTNHMIITRKMQELYKNNVVDFNQEGKNKVFFIKKTAEARGQIIITEQYKLLQTLHKYPILRAIVEKLQNNKKIKLAILFGSYAKNLADKNSDIDMYIETKNRELKKELSLLDSKLNIKIGIYNKENNLIKEIEKDHIIIKGGEEYYEKSQFFN